jgi:hypothetical protein
LYFFETYFEGAGMYEICGNIILFFTIPWKKSYAALSIYFDLWAVQAAPENVKNKIVNFEFHRIHPYLEEKL